VHPDVIAEIEKDLQPLDSLIKEEWFTSVIPRRIPQLADFLTLQRITEVSPHIPEPPVAYEDKFRILYAPSCLLPDLESMRRDCEMRGLPISIVFLDIDDFKQWNSKYTEPRIDADVLPQFMRIVERAVFGHGSAYRHGGDECVLLLPNFDGEHGRIIVNGLRKALAEATYPGITERLSVSCGMCTVLPDGFLTDREILERSAHAKKFAKEGGKNRVAGYQGALFRDTDLHLLV
jgi:diguanylate cyclase (GGDEF)-like protein